MTEIFKQFGVSANIIFGNIEILKGTPLGKLAVTLEGDAENVVSAVEFIKAHGVRIEEVK